MESIESLIAAIRAGMEQTASADARAAGASACRTLLAVLEAKPGQPLATPNAASVPASSVQTIVTLLRNAPPEQLLDLAIAKLRTLVPPTEQPTVRAFPIRLVPVSKP